MVRRPKKIENPEIPDRSQFMTPAAGLADSVNILLIEDDTETADEIIGELKELGHNVVHVEDGITGLKAAREQSYDIVVVDRMLPRLDGLNLVATLRSERINVPVLVLSALSDVDDRVRGLKAGGDDYLSKPFALSELAARIEALLRRPAMIRETVLRVGPLELDLIDRAAFRNGRKIELLAREFKLLEYMMRRPAQVLTRAMLLEGVWNYRFLAETNLVDVHIGKLRRKIDGANDLPLIHTIKGTGFMLCPLP